MIPSTLQRSPFWNSDSDREKMRLDPENIPRLQVRQRFFRSSPEHRSGLAEQRRARQLGQWPVQSRGLRVKCEAADSCARLDGSYQGSSSCQNAMSAGSASATALQLLFAGVGNGAIYALIALGFNVIFKSTGALNFAQGEWVMLGGMIAAAAVAAHADVWLGCLVAVVIVAAVRLFSERLIVAPLKRPTPMLITLLSIGLAISTKSVVMLAFGKDPAGYPGFSGDAVLSIFGARVPAQTLWIIGITLAFIVMAHAFFERTILGKSLRAVAADREAASLVGINVRHSVMWSFVIGALAGGIAGTIITPLTFTSYDQGGLIRIQRLQCGDAWRHRQPLWCAGWRDCARLAGNNGRRIYLISFQGAVAFIVLLTILFALPSGLLGRSEAERV